MQRMCVKRLRYRWEISYQARNQSCESMVREVSETGVRGSGVMGVLRPSYPTLRLSGWAVTNIEWKIV